jgi:hypothetical protein
MNETVSVKLMVQTSQWALTKEEQLKNPLDVNQPPRCVSPFVDTTSKTLLSMDGQDGDIKCASSQIKDENVLFSPLVKAICHGCSSGLLDDPSNARAL